MQLGPVTFTLEQAFKADTTGRAIWIGYGTYRSLDDAKAAGATRFRPCRIVAARVVWASPGAPLEA